MLSGKDSCHYLSCGVCRWDSLEIGVKFDRPTGIAREYYCIVDLPFQIPISLNFLLVQMQKAESESPSVAEFEQLREHYEKLGRLYSSTAVAAGSTSNIIAGGLGKNRLLPSSLGSNSKFAFQKKEAMALTTYQCISNDVSSLGFHEKTSYLESSEVHQSKEHNMLD